MMYFPILNEELGPDEPENPQNHRVVEFLANHDEDCLDERLAKKHFHALRFFLGIGFQLLVWFDDHLVVMRNVFLWLWIFFLPLGLNVSIHVLHSSEFCCFLCVYW